MFKVLGFGFGDTLPILPSQHLTCRPLHSTQFLLTRYWDHLFSVL